MGNRVDANMTVRIINEDVFDGLYLLRDESVHCVVTSPPYFGLRDYGIDGQIGLEPTPDAYVEKMVAVFRAVKRVLRKDGTCWLNLGDSYGANYRGGGIENASAKQISNRGTLDFMADSMPRYPDIKPKDLIGIPWRVAFALQADGWWLRQDIIWSKPNPMPESVTDRCTKAHEYIFLLTKAERYFFDQEPIREEPKPGNDGRMSAPVMDGYRSLRDGYKERRPQNRKQYDDIKGANRRSVWEVTTQPFPEAHFATFPPALIEPCIKAGTSEKGCCARCGSPYVRQTETIDRIRVRQGSNTSADASVIAANGQIGKTSIFSSGEKNVVGTVGWSSSCKCEVGKHLGPLWKPCTILDPFGGSGTTGLVADRLKRNAILIELNPEYAAMAERRVKGDSPLFAEVSA